MNVFLLLYDNPRLSWGKYIDKSGVMEFLFPLFNLIAELTLGLVCERYQTVWCGTLRLLMYFSR